MKDLHQLTNQLEAERRKTRAQAREISRLRQQVTELERARAESQWGKAVGNFAPSYVSALASLSHVAYTGMRRPDDLGTTLSTTAKGGPPKYDSPASVRLKRELEHQEQRADQIDHWVARRVDPDTPDAPESDRGEAA